MLQYMYISIVEYCYCILANCYIATAWRYNVQNTCKTSYNNVILLCTCIHLYPLPTGFMGFQIILIIIIIQLYFRPQWVHRKYNTKNVEHVNITQIRLKHAGLPHCCEVI